MAGSTTILQGTFRSSGTVLEFAGQPPLTMDIMSSVQTRRRIKEQKHEMVACRGVPEQGNRRESSMWKRWDGVRLCEGEAKVYQTSAFAARR